MFFAEYPGKPKQYRNSKGSAWESPEIPLFYLIQAFNKSSYQGQVKESPQIGYLCKP